MRIKTFGVSEVNEYIKKLLSVDIILNNLQVEGEISNFKYHSSGHMYFSLKDDKSRLRCVMFKGQAKLLKFIPEDGMKVIIKGYISLYERDGQYQLYVQQMQPAGIGALYIAYEQLKKKLEQEGLFNEATKKPLPFLPQRIGVVTSPTGAALRDIISVINRRNSNVEIIIFPVLVQGIESKDQIAKAINYLNSNNYVDVIITGRGGGSIEELWAFNEEVVARSIYSSNIPIISAVGHETDFTISDFVADVRAATPSAAAELVIPSKKDLEYTIQSIEQRMIKATENTFIQQQNRIERIRKSNVFLKPYDQINQYKQQLDWLNSNLKREMEQSFNIKKEKYQGILKNLFGLSPKAVLNRGFNILKDEKDNFIVSVKGLSKGEHVNVILKDGVIKCLIEDVKKGGLKNDNKKE
jgi:exodeoxyribonuclease VII large subunit